MGGRVVLSPTVVVEGDWSLGGDPPEAKARSAGGLYLAPIRSSASSSRALNIAQLVTNKKNKLHLPFSVGSRWRGRWGLA